MENVKNPTEAGILCMIDKETFHSSMKNTWISNLGALCDITNYDTSLYDVTKINQLIQESSGHMTATKKGKL